MLLQLPALVLSILAAMSRIKPKEANKILSPASKLGRSYRASSLLFAPSFVGNNPNHGDLSWSNNTSTTEMTTLSSCHGRSVMGSEGYVHMLLVSASCVQTGNVCGQAGRSGGYAYPAGLLGLFSLST